MRLPQFQPFPYCHRARFLSSTAAAFVASATVLVVGASDPEVCEAAASLFDNSILTSSKSINTFDDNPRYIDTELQMKYGEGPGMYAVWCAFRFLSFFLSFVRLVVCLWMIPNSLSSRPSSILFFLCTHT
jgi:hypothetical protein